MKTIFFLLVLSSLGVVFPLRIQKPMQPNVFLNTLETGVQIATSPVRRDDAFYKNDVIKAHLDKKIVFKSYCNTHFRQLRRLAGISENQFSNSIQLLNIFHSDSKSGQQFWKSDNGLIVLKTMPKYESKTMREIIDPYTAHLSDINQPSCLSLVLGMYSISIKGKVTYLICLNNVFPSDTSNVIDMYDIKGSTVGRKASSTSKVMKDLDALTKMRNSDDRILQLRTSQFDLLTRAINRDILFLEDLNLMDYSLLVGIEVLSSSALSSPFVSSSTQSHVHHELKSGPVSGGRTGVLDMIAALKHHSRTDANVNTDSETNTNSNNNNNRAFKDSDCDADIRHNQISNGESVVFLPRGKMTFDVNMPPRRYHLGIVDFLQKYTARKHMETLGKGLWYNASHISAVDAKFYGQRFLRFIKLMGGVIDVEDSS